MNVESQVLPPLPGSLGGRGKLKAYEIIFYRFLSDEELMFCDAGTNNHRILTESPKVLKSLIAWFMKSGHTDPIFPSNTTPVSTVAWLVDFLFSQGSDPCSTLVVMRLLFRVGYRSTWLLSFVEGVQRD